MNYIQIFIGLNFDIDKHMFVQNYNKDYCNKQYKKYMDLKKAGEVPLIAPLTCPPDYYSDITKISL